jgi:membrane-bound lytic murein transglycosylase MltF
MGGVELELAHNVGGLFGAPFGLDINNNAAEAFVGYYHLQDAREITRKLNKNPNRWIDVKQALPLLAQRKWYKDTRYGYARGWEPVRYVENIRSYYDILKWVDEGDIEVTPTPEEFLKIPNSL